MDVGRLLKIKETVLQYPRRTTMDKWHGKGHHCIGGWAQTLFSPRWLDRVFNGLFARYMTAGEMAALLGMTYDETCSLFYIGQWPGGMFNAFEASRTDEQRAELIAERIDQVIADATFLKSVNVASV